jgi:DNA-binding CsgD family transcriptional regulator/tetratricopeptide (TPR) repeat protein
MPVRAGCPARTDREIDAARARPGGQNVSMDRSGPTSMFGRGDELAELREAVDASSGSVVVISGEAGIGKSLLMRVYLQESRTRGDRVLSGGCVELLGDPIPYAPFSEALRELYSTLDRSNDERVADHVRESLDLLVGVRPAEVGTGRHGLFERVLRLLEELVPKQARGADQDDDTQAWNGRQGRLVLAIDDLHWADRATLDLMIFLARNLTGPFALILTCRSEGLAGEGPLRTVLNSLRHGRGLHRVGLDRLSRRHIEQIARRQDPAASESQIDQIFGRSEGNPLIAEELLESTSRGVSMTQSLEELLLARTDSLDPDGIRVVQLVSMLGRRVDHDTLSAACDLPESALLNGLSDAVRSGVLSFDRERDDYGFCHLLTMDAVAAQMLPGERRYWHGRIARAISDQPETRSSAGRSAEAANHWYASDSVADAYAAALTAGRLAAQVFAYDEAWRHFQQALRLAELIGGLTDDEVGRIVLLGEAAEAARWAGDLDEAVKLTATAADLESDRESSGRLRERLGRYLWEAGRANEAAEAYERADDDLATATASATAASVKASRANLLMITGQHTAAIPIARWAEALALETGAELPAARAQITVGMSLIFLGQPDEGSDLVLRGQRVVARLGDLDERRRASSNLAYALLMVGKTGRACDVAMEGVALIRRYGLEAKAGAALAGNALVLLRHVGRWDEAESLSDHILQQGIPDAQARSVHLARVGLEIARGNLVKARMHLDRANPSAVLDQTPPMLAAELLGAEAELALEEGHLDQARRLAARAAAMLSVSEHTRVMVQILRLGLQIEADIAQGHGRSLRQDPGHHASREYLHGLLMVIGGSPLLDVTAHRVTAEAEYARCLKTGDPEAWAQPIREWEGLERPRELAYCCLRAAEAGLDSRRAATAPTQALIRGYRIAADIGAEPLVRFAVDLARRSRITLTDTPRDELAAASGPVSSQGPRFTPRERDVLRELALGSSNKEIAAQLFISQRTVAVHVSNVMAKLAVSRRGQAAAAAIRLGLIDN